jgi:hypothetical protein
MFSAAALQETNRSVMSDVRANSKKANTVIPGREAKRSEPGIHTHDRGYGFRACAKGRIPE